MYTILLKWWTRDKDFYAIPPDYTKTITGDTLKECMNKVADFKLKHDVYKYTAAEIVDVTEENEVI